MSPYTRACLYYLLFLLSAVVNGTTPAFSVAAAAASANPPVLPPALPARETNPWAAGAPASAQPGGKQLFSEVELESLH